MLTQSARWRLKVARAEHRWTLAELAAKSGVGLQTINGIETGRIQSPRLGTLIALADALGVARSEVVGAEEVAL